MRWACPHCKISLETPSLGQNTEVKGPQPGWAYARCQQCKGFAAVELSSGQAVAIDRSAGDAPKQVTPPPFRHGKPNKAAAADVAPILAPIEAPLVESEPVFAQPIEAGPPPEERLQPSSSPFALLSSLRRPRPSRFYAAMAGLAMIALLGGLKARHWARPAPSAPALATAAAPRQEPTQLERAHAAAERVHPQQAPAAPLPAALPAARLANRAEVSDSIRSAAMAPRRPQSAEIQLYLQARKSARSMELRTGPGPDYPLFGLADLDERYPVVEWKNRWFRIQLEETPGLTAWVSYDRAELFSEDNKKGNVDDR